MSIALLAPTISVLVSTRDRPEHVVGCVRSILASPRANFEVIVIDQSSKANYEIASGALGTDPRLSWIRTRTNGLSLSRNIGVAQARAPIIAFTDDDCRVDTDWLRLLEDVFDNDSQLALVFGSVSLRPEDRAVGYAAEFEPTRCRYFQGCFPDIRTQWGVGANMAVRRSVFARIGDFDSLLGAGALLLAGEDIDLTVRALAAGFKMGHLPELGVLHLGIRRGEDAARLLRGYGSGLGAALGKHVRLGTPGASGLLAGIVGHHGLRSVGNLMRGHRHPGFGLLAGILFGASRASVLPLDRKRGRFEPLLKKDQPESWVEPALRRAASMMRARGY
jgi:hypothetical protein